MRVGGVENRPRAFPHRPAFGCSTSLQGLFVKERLIFQALYCLAIFSLIEF